MYVLGIETSCDETSAAIVKDGKIVLSNIISSSVKLHSKYGGIIPEIAFRKQLETITQVVEAAVRESGVDLKKIGLVSVTNGPGLLGSLIVGISFAKSLSFSLELPLLGINHIYAHIYSNFLRQKQISLPAVALIVSGGHTSIFFVKDWDRIETLGETQDDACGEAFDKVAKILRLGYPGGPVIEKMALKGNPKKIKFNCSGTKKPLNFSFSGIKTAVLYYLKNHALGNVNQNHPVSNKRLICDIAASFQDAAIDALVRKSLLACSMKETHRLIVGGGVAVNGFLRKKMLDSAKLAGVEVSFPANEFCMDNAAMIAGLGYRLFKKGYRDDLQLNVRMDG